MNKNDLARAVYQTHGGMSFADAIRIVDTMLEIIKKRLVEGQRVVLSGFGSFRVVRRRDKKGVNPQTGSSITIAGRNAVRFKPSKYLRSV